MNLQLWNDYVDTLPYQPLFVTVSGAHVYGFPSPDSDVDLRGCHLLPLEQIVGLGKPKETWQREEIHQHVEVDLVSHEVGKYLRLLIKNNGYIMEQVFSPLVVRGQEFLDQLRPLARKCLTRNHFYHYRGFFCSQRELIEKQDVKTAKAVLYAYRVLLTGTHLMESGQVEPDLRVLNQKYHVPDIDQLIAGKTREKATVAIDWDLHRQRMDKLADNMEQAREASSLPDNADRGPINDFLVSVRLGRS